MTRECRLIGPTFTVNLEAVSVTMGESCLAKDVYTGTLLALFEQCSSNGCVVKPRLRPVRSTGCCPVLTQGGYMKRRR
jgi:hypothetical protein